MQISQGPSLPVELWMQILDNVTEEQNLDAIARCARVCQFFKHMCEKHLWDGLGFWDDEDMERLKTDTAETGIGGWRGPQRVTIWSGKDSKSIPHVATFASRFAGRWTRIEQLRFAETSWPSSLRAADAAVFRNLSGFASITKLDLYDVTFPSIVTFGALISALSGLNELYLLDVNFTGSSVLSNPRTLSDFRLLPPTKNLRNIIVGYVSEDGHHGFHPSAWPCYIELLTFMIAVSNPCGKSPRVYPWGSVRNLRLDENVWWKFSSSSIARLLHALPSLENLNFATADSNVADLEITSVPAQPRLEPIAIGVYGASAQPRNVAHIIRRLIDMDYPLRIMRIYAAVYPFLEDTDTLVATAINELVQHAGPSLDDLGLFLKGNKDDADWAPFGEHSELDAAADQHRQCDFFENTNPTSLRIHGCDASCLGAREILSHFTLRCVSSVNVRFKPLARSDRRELSEGLSQLDTVLLPSVFHNLVHVLISVRFARSRCHVEMKEMTEWAHLVKSCLARLHELGILGCVSVHPCAIDNNNDPSH
ncbi:hypothetical protein POSPLADRAFT_1181506 [Postia placenta MAD-698-R-SB12]|uniref:F-box domain-containing protein n=1 Tax=Postia placenta MAD-698-R-SB12 TaxID=670580 RepID=A0A1X6N1M5_9APHY|nr:hypothetical protein POSPLADRAFT_1181506 [Postia placenta MAD-698-R-SB12]OSX62410.1 hypothetical protein POSPLADRAFT_1181506 [Postia placenta MAD-698-R-SB12]